MYVLFYLQSSVFVFLSLCLLSGFYFNICKKHFVCFSVLFPVKIYITMHISVYLNTKYSSEHWKTEIFIQHFFFISGFVFFKIWQLLSSSSVRLHMANQTIAFTSLNTPGPQIALANQKKNCSLQVWTFLSGFSMSFHITNRKITVLKSEKCWVRL